MGVNQNFELKFNRESLRFRNEEGKADNARVLEPLLLLSENSDLFSANASPTLSDKR